MNKFIITVFLSIGIFVSTANAQKLSSIRFQLSPQKTQLINDDSFKGREGIDPQATFGVGAGVTFEFNLNHNFSFETGLLLSRQGQNYTLYPAKLKGGCLLPGPFVSQEQLDETKLDFILKRLKNVEFKI